MAIRTSTTRTTRTSRTSRTTIAPAATKADALEAKLLPYALPSAYPNYFGPDRPEQAAQAYGQNTARLLRIKARYDPNGVFAATSLPVLAQAKAAVGRC